MPGCSTEKATLMSPEAPEAQPVSHVYGVRP